jgi:CRISPR-associated endonuclease/helicase Cas3
MSGFGFDDFFLAATGVAPYEYQRAFATAPALPDLLEAPTGAGKTATAVLGWLWRRRHGRPQQRAEAGRRLVFCLPMRTLVEPTERAVQRWRARLGLAPGELGVHLLLGGAVDDTWEEHPDRDAILIGTQDQLLSRALMRGYAMSRYRWPVHFALLHNDCTWVMDEFQLMGVGTSTAAQLQALRERLQVAGSTKTIWMSTTMAEGRLHTIDVRRPLTRQPFVGIEPALQARLYARKTLAKARTTIGTPEERGKSGDKGETGILAGLAEEVASAHELGTLTLVVMNRVARAQALRGLLEKRTGEPLALVHSRFRPADRRRLEDAVLTGAFRGILVATQAIEASVDLSAKTLFTELAPWASLVQRCGRLNRAGEHAEARAFWIDLDTANADVCLPYEPVLLTTARQRLLGLRDVSPAALATLVAAPETPSLPVLNRKDLLALFDTEPDLAGHDTDISRYVQATDDRDVQVAWRNLGRHPPSADAPELQRDELCPVPLHALEELTRDRNKVWRFDPLRRAWTSINRLYPGLAVVVDVACGGYDSGHGFTGGRHDVPTSLERPGSPPDDDEADRLACGAASYVTMRTHADDIADEMASLLAELGTVTEAFMSAHVLIDAARWHDAGKVHPAFQAMLIGGLPAGDPRRKGGPWAKSDGKLSARNPRHFFRHELASALAWLAEDRDELGAFIIAAHHGKVRLSLRARPDEEPPVQTENRPRRRFAHGVHDGDVLPAVDLGAGVRVPEQTLSLGCMELRGGDGPPWIDRMQRLLEVFGPFRLAYLEMLVRVADWRATQKRAPRSSVASDEVARG